MKLESRNYILRGLTPLLGSQPADSKIRTTYIASKAPLPEEQGQAETDMLPDENKGYTVFLRDHGGLVLMDYAIIGYFKGAVKAMESENGVKQSASKVGTYVFAEPRILPILRNGERIEAPDSVLERSLRAQTMQGPRTTLSASEMIESGWELNFTLKLLDNAGSVKSRAITWDVLESALDYGALKGIGQWRNGGYGRFAWERTE